LISPKQEIEIKDIAGIASYTKIIEERVLFTFDDKQEVTYLKGVDANYSKVNAIESKLYNGQWLQPNTYQVVVLWIAQKFSLGLLDFNRWKFWPKPGKGQLKIQKKRLIKPILFRWVFMLLVKT
jgi:lipoprotein-releasing system permease protein